MKRLRNILLFGLFSCICIYSYAQVTPKQIQKILLKKDVIQKLELLKKVKLNFSAKSTLDYNVWKKGKYIQPNNLGGKDSMFMTSVQYSAIGFIPRYISCDSYEMFCEGLNEDQELDPYRKDYVRFQFRTESTKEYIVKFHIEIPWIVTFLKTVHDTHWIFNHSVVFDNSTFMGYHYETFSYSILDDYNGIISLVLSPRQLIKDNDLQNSYPITEEILIFPNFVKNSGYPDASTKWYLKGIEVKEIQ